MATSAVTAATPPEQGEDAATERRTSPVEPFWDLVFAFAVTQVTTLLRADLPWVGAGRALRARGAGAPVPA